MVGTSAVQPGTSMMVMDTIRVRALSGVASRPGSPSDERFEVVICKDTLFLDVAEIFLSCFVSVYRHLEIHVDLLPRQAGKYSF